MSVKQSEAIARRFEQVFNTGNTEDVAEYIAPGFVQHGPGTPSVPPGPEGYKEIVRAYRSAFPDINVTIDEIIATEHSAAIRYHARGTFLGELVGISPTGKSFEVMGTDTVHIADGKITEAWQLYDTLAFNEQLGLLQLLPQAEVAR